MMNNKELNNYINNETLNDLTSEKIDNYTKIIEHLNRLVTTGTITTLDLNTLKSLFTSRSYMKSDLEFLISLNIKLTKTHCFYDGNKRTATKVFKFLLKEVTPYEIKKFDFEEYQLKLLNNKIKEEDYFSALENSLYIQSAKPNEKLLAEKLIPRGEVSSELEESNNQRPSLTLENLAKSNSFFKLLNKPYFQRDTNSWDVSKLERLIDSFMNDMLIPSVILWKSKKDGTFIIDGAHRLSALSCWVNDDYGKSIDYKNHLQIKQYIDNSGLNYKQFLNNEDKSVLSILSDKSINIEWIRGDYEIVKDSFIRINEQGVKISLDEKEMIKNDKKNTSILSRKILSYTGGQETRSSNEMYDSKIIYEKLFTPKYNNLGRIFPVGGNIRDEFLISRVFNLLRVIDSDDNLSLEKLSSETLKILELITDNFELNNRIYFYGIKGHYKLSALLGIVSFLKKISNEKGGLSNFKSIRGNFENYIINNPDEIQQIVRKYREVSRALPHITNYYYEIYESLKIKQEVNINEKFSYLKKHKLTHSTKKTMENYLKELKVLQRCAVCNGYLNNYSEKEKHRSCQ